MDKCCAPAHKPKTQSLNRVLWIALALNFIMFLIEFGSSFVADSQSLKADSLDFLGDSANYAISLFVIGFSLTNRAKASIIKAVSMGALGVWVAVEIVLSIYKGAAPNSELMTWLGFAGLAVNGFVTWLLYQFREGDSNMRSVWLCSRNDAIGNIAVIGAAYAVSYFQTYWPDLIVAGLMAYLAISASIKIIKLAMAEIESERQPSSCQKVARHLG